MAWRVMLLALAMACLEQSAQAQPKAGPAATFYRDVLPIVQERCQACHRTGEIGPMPLVTYRDARPWSREIQKRTGSKEMPPWFADPRYGRFSNDPSLTPRQIATLAAWADAGAPAGNPHDAPPPRQWAEGWVIPSPGHGRENAEAGDHSRARRCRLHL